MVPTLLGRLKGAAIGPYAALAAPFIRKPLTITKRIVDDTKVTDHHAIIPTGEAISLATLSADERRLYDLILRRFLSLFCGPCRYDETKLTIEIAGEKLYASGKVVKQAGWKDVYGSTDFTDPDREDKETEDDTAQLLPQASEKDRGNCAQRSSGEPCKQSRLLAIMKLPCSRRWRNMALAHLPHGQILSRSSCPPTRSSAKAPSSSRQARAPADRACLRGASFS